MRATTNAMRLRPASTSSAAGVIDPKPIQAEIEALGRFGLDEFGCNGAIDGAGSRRPIFLATFFTASWPIALSKAETLTVAAIEGGVPALVEAREVIAAFHAMIRRKGGTDLAGWVDRARKSLVASFANGVAKDEAAVQAAIISPWSNGQTEGQITKLKLVKRQMYRRAKIDLGAVAFGVGIGLRRSPARLRLSDHAARSMI
jgi:hypothetical protein